LRLIYGTSDAASTRTISVKPVSASGPGTAFTPSTSIPTTAQAAGTTQTLDITSNLVTPVHTNGLTDLNLSYSTALTNGKAERIDAVLLDVKFIGTGTSTRAEDTTAVPSNCLAIPYTSGSAGTGRCALIYTSTSYKGNFYIQGTTYTPLAPLDIALSNITAQVLRFGVIARSLQLWETGSVSYQGPVIEIPDNSPGYGVADTVVYLTVYVCSGSSTCKTPSDTTTSAPTGKLALRTRVYIHDPTGAPVAGSRQMTVQSWAVQR
jgi:hypothetical protein